MPGKAAAGAKRTRSAADAESAAAAADAEAAAAALREDLEIYEKFFFEKFEAEAVRVGLRHDGRRLDEARKVAVTTGVLDEALGSALVEQGATRALCGTRVGFVPPFGDDKDHGRIEVRCTLSPTAADWTTQDILGAQNSGNAIAEYVQRVLTSARMVDTKQLLVEKEHCALCLHVDLYLLSCAGGHRDACLHAAVAALRDTVLPHVEFADSTPSVVPGKTRPLEVSEKYPVSVSVGVYQGKVLVDLTEQEQEVAGPASIVHDSSLKLLNVHRSGGARLSTEVLKECIAAGRKQAAVLCKSLNAATATEAAGDAPPPAKKPGKKAAKKKGRLF